MKRCFFHALGYLSKEHQCWLSKGLSLLDDISVDRIEYSGDSKRKKYFFNLTGDVSTNYTRHQINNIERGFDGCLDYIWGSQNIQVSPYFALLYGFLHHFSIYCSINFPTIPHRGWFIKINKLFYLGNFDKEIIRN